MEKEIKKQAAVRDWEVIYVDEIKKSGLGNLDDVCSYDMYELIEPGVVKLSAGVRGKNTGPLMFNVSQATDILKDKYRYYIRNLQIQEVLGEFKKPSPVGRIVTLLPLDGIYGDLDKNDRDSLGREFVYVESTPHGIKIGNVVTIKNMSDNVYLRVHPELLDGTEVLGVVFPELCELVEREKGYFVQAGDENVKKIGLK